MALTYNSGTRVEIIKGSHKGKRGKVVMKGHVKIVLLDDNKTEIFAINDDNVRKV